MPKDVYSIVIGGNRLSRGLTIEGLSISYYTRHSVDYAEDTTVQRGRWFGYRGSHLEYCRVFTHRDLAIRLSRFHEHDEDLREQLARNLQQSRPPTDATFRFLRLQDSKPTMKLGRGVSGALEIAGTKLFVDRVQMGMREFEVWAAQRNQERTAEACRQVIAEGSAVCDASGDQIGSVRREMPASVVAEPLDSLAFTWHNPDPRSGMPFNLQQWYRAPVPELGITQCSFSPRGDPLLIGAYLRFWQSAFERCIHDPSRNVFTGASGLSRWEPCPAPTFAVGVRYGSLKPASGSPFTFMLLNREINREGFLGSRWGGHGYGGRGDEWIDMDPPGKDPSSPRPRGSSGLLLIHVVSREAEGRERTGAKYQYDRPAFGVVIPEGGPCLAFVMAGPAVMVQE